MDAFMEKVRIRKEVVSAVILIKFIFQRTQIAPSLKPFVSGMVAGSFATAITYPFDLLRTRFAVQGTSKVRSKHIYLLIQYLYMPMQVYKSLSHAILDINEKEGIKGFYRGLGSSIIQIMPYMGLMFFSYEGLSSIIQNLKVEREKKKEKLKDIHVNLFS